MEPHYSSGMIWVGTEAETGAQISVSSVRGDYVLWLDDQALNATAFMKDGVRRPCSFMQLQQVGGRATTNGITAVRTRSGGHVREGERPPRQFLFRTE